MTPDAMLQHALFSRDSIRFWNMMAKKYPRNAERYKEDARWNLKRACFWIDELRINREKKEARYADGHH